MWRPTALIAAVAGLLGWVLYCLYSHPPRIVEGLSSESARALAAAGLTGVRPSFRGREAVLEGAVASPEARSRAEEVVALVPGVRRVESRLAVAAEAEPEPLPAHLEIRARPAGVTLLGPVPSAARRSELVARAQEIYGADRVEDRLVVDASVAEGAAVAGAVAILDVLARARHDVEARLEGDALRLSGAVSSAEAKRRVEEEAQAAAPRVRLFFSDLRVEAPPAPGEEAPEEPSGTGGEGVD